MFFTSQAQEIPKYAHADVATVRMGRKAGPVLPILKLRHRVKIAR